MPGRKAGVADGPAVPTAGPFAFLMSGSGRSTSHFMPSVSLLSSQLPSTPLVLRRPQIQGSSLRTCRLVPPLTAEPPLPRPPRLVKLPTLVAPGLLVPVAPFQA